MRCRTTMNSSPPQAGHRIRFPHRILQALGDALDQLVPDGMAEGIVDGLETVQVDEQHPHLMPLPGGGGNGHGEPVLQQHAVGQAGERIVLGQELDAVLGRLVLREVGVDGDVVADRPGGIGHGADGGPLGMDAAVLGPVPDFPLPVAGLFQAAPQIGVERLVVAAGLEETGRPPPRLFQGVAGDGDEGPVHQQDAVFRIGDEDRFPALFQHAGPQAQLVLPAADGVGHVLQGIEKAGELDAARRLPGDTVVLAGLDPFHAGQQVQHRPGDAPVGQGLAEGHHQGPG